MEWFTLDPDTLQRDQLIENFTSAIWTERYAQNGDFQFQFASPNQAIKRLLTPGTYVGKSDSYYTMTVDTVTDGEDSSGQRLINVTGTSWESMLDDRPGMPALADLTATPTWNLTDTPGNIMRTMFSTVCYSGGVSSLDTIPFYHTGTLLPAGGIAEDGTPITVALNPASLYTQLKTVGDPYNLGFRLVRNGDAGEVYFEVYTGTDRTSNQTDVPAVIFSEALDNLSKDTELTSIAGYKTVAVVFATNGSAEVYQSGVDSAADGFQRRVLLVDASDITLGAGPDLDTAMAIRGLQELATHNKIYQFDGEIPQNGNYTYGIDFELGDLVEEQDTTGFGNFMLVTEHISVSDSNGERAYPTLTLFQTTVAGTWAGWTPATDTWNTVDGSDEWETV
jgi:hypothetical protein